MILKALRDFVASPQVSALHDLTEVLMDRIFVTPNNTVGAEGFDDERAEELEGKLDEATRDIRELESAVNALESDRDELRREINDAVVARDELQARLDDAQTEIANLRAAYANNH